MGIPRAIATVYHLVEAGNWPSVQANGLLSARALMQTSDRSRSADEKRRHRPQSVVLSPGVMIRHQRPMPPAALARCLDEGLTPEDWYALLNAKVFFWLDVERLNRQRKACGAAPQVALTFDASRLLAAHGERAAVSPFNTGNAMRAAARRGRSTFVPYERWRMEGWAAEGGRVRRSAAHRPVELTIADAVPDVMTYVTAVTPLGEGEMLVR